MTAIKDTPPKSKSQVFIFPVERFVSTFLQEVCALRKIRGLILQRDLHILVSPSLVLFKTFFGLL